MNTVQFPNRELLEEQAAAWVSVIDRGLSSDEEHQLNLWLDQSPLHGESLVHLASTWDLLDLLRPIAKFMPIEDNEDFASTATSVDKPLAEAPTSVVGIASRAWSQGRTFAIAAGISMLAVAVLFEFELFPDLNDKQAIAQSQVGDQLLPSEPKMNFQRFVTEIGEQSNITLSDGSEIKLNTDSVVSVQFSENERKIILSRGEAYFDVAKNPDRPFVVLTDRSRVTAVGTAFSVDVSHTEDTEVLVTEGRVKVDQFATPSGVARDNKGLGSSQPQTPVFLSQGQKASLNRGSAQVSYHDDIDSALAWRDGMIVFSGESLEQAVNEIDRYLPLEFKIVDREIASIEVGGFFKTGDLDQLLIILEQNFGVESNRVGNQILLSKAK